MGFSCTCSERRLDEQRNNKRASAREVPVRRPRLRGGLSIPDVPCPLCVELLDMPIPASTPAAKQLAAIGMEGIAPISRRKSRSQVCRDRDRQTPGDFVKRSRVMTLFRSPRFALLAVHNRAWSLRSRSIRAPCYERRDATEATDAPTCRTAGNWYRRLRDCRGIPIVALRDSSVRAMAVARAADSRCSSCNMPSMRASRSSP